MHDEARAFVARCAAANVGTYPASAVEFGGRDVNGGVRDLFPCTAWTSIDLQAGLGVDVVADARSWRPPKLVDLVVCCEVAEHCPDPGRLVANAYRALKAGGLFLFTAACDNRAPHSAVDGGPLRDGEHYENVDPDALRGWLGKFSSVDVEVHARRGDVYAAAVKGRARGQ